MLKVDVNVGSKLASGELDVEPANAAPGVPPPNLPLRPSKSKCRQPRIVPLHDDVEIILQRQFDSVLQAQIQFAA